MPQAETSAHAKTSSQPTAIIKTRPMHRLPYVVRKRGIRNRFDLRASNAETRPEHYSDPRTESVLADGAAARNTAVLY
jgi:hypothetical protein